MGLLDKLKNSLAKTRQIFTKNIETTLNKNEHIDDTLFDELEEILITSDIGIKCSKEILANLKKNIKEKKLKYKPQAKEELQNIIQEILHTEEKLNINTIPSVIIMLGINGVGKTTTIAKLAYFLQQKNKDILMCAADTFRAAAIDQLQIWAKKIDCPIISHKQGADPASVVYDSINSAIKKNISVVICDTAGRMHTKKGLMNEIEKIVRIAKKQAEGLDTEILLNIDATTGQNGLIQAKSFLDSCNITGSILTKLDGTAKGGIIIPIKKQLNVPIKFIGTGETVKDLQEFDSENFTKSLFNYN